MAKLGPKEKVTELGGRTHSVLQAFVSFVSFVGESTAALFESLSRPKRMRWRETLYYMNGCGPNGAPIVIMICLLMGVVLAYQSGIQLSAYGGETFLPMLIGCTIARELGPLMVAVVATGRNASAFAAEIGTMKISEELDAMVTMGLRPARFLVVPKMLAMLLMLPLLTVIGDMAGIFGGALIGYAELGIPFETYFNLTRQDVEVKYFFEGLIKSVVFAWIITIVGCWRGFRTGNDAVAVGRSTTTAVVLSILLVVVMDTVLAKVFAELYGWG